MPGQAESRVHTSVEIYAHNNGSQESVPAWVAFDRKVTTKVIKKRFSDSMVISKRLFMKREKKPIGSDSKELIMLIHRVNIYFYLEDDTVHVSEPKTENSGIPQGKFKFIFISRNIDQKT